MTEQVPFFTSSHTFSLKYMVMIFLVTFAENSCAFFFWTALVSTASRFAQLTGRSLDFASLACRPWESHDRPGKTEALHSSRESLLRARSYDHVAREKAEYVVLSIIILDNCSEKSMSIEDGILSTQVSRKRTIPVDMNTDSRHGQYRIGESGSFTLKIH